MLCYKKSGTQT